MVKLEFFLSSGEFGQISKNMYMLMVSLISRPDHKSQGIWTKIMEIILTTITRGPWKTKGRLSKGNKANVDP